MATFSNSKHAETLILDSSCSSVSRRPVLHPKNVSSTNSSFSRISSYPPPSPSCSSSFSRICRTQGPFLSTAVVNRKAISSSFALNPVTGGVDPAGRKKVCMCSPTTHPGSFRCSIHRNTGRSVVVKCSNRISARRSAMVNSIVRIGGVEGEFIQRALKSLIRPCSSHNLRRKEVFKPQPSRLSRMSMAEDCVN